jgi:hypothetical protein
MTFRQLLIPLLFATAITTLEAQSRSWKSADGQRSIQGEFLKRDATSVTIVRADRKSIAIPVDQLHPDDRTWLDANHPLKPTATTPKPQAEPPAEAPPKGAVFDKLQFGDDRDTVLTKLKASKFVEMTTDETFIGRSGLNGVFRTKQKVGEMDAMLFFDWTDANQLKEITLQTEALPASDLAAKLTPCWKQFIELLSSLQGKAMVGDTALRISSIPDGAFSPTHLWKLDPLGSAQLGAAREGDKYQVVVRFTKDEVKPVELP